MNLVRELCAGRVVRPRVRAFSPPHPGSPGWREVEPGPALPAVLSNVSKVSVSVFGQWLLCSTLPLEQKN